MDPAQRTRERMAGPAVDRKYDDLVHDEYSEDDERLLKRGLGADLLMFAGRDVRDQRKGHGVLAQHRPLKDIQEQPREPPTPEATGPWRGDRPIQDRQYQERG